MFKNSLRQRPTLTELLTSDEVLQGAATRDLLLGYGIRLFHRYGVEGTSIGRLLQVSGKSKSQFYSHFSSREEFVCQILARQMDTMIRVGSRHPLDSLEDFPQWFQPYQELADLPGHLGCPTGPLASDMSPSSEIIQAQASRQFHLWEDHVTRCFQHLGERLNFSESFSARETARQFCCSVQGGFLLGRVHQTGDYIRLVGQQFEKLLSSCIVSPAS